MKKLLFLLLSILLLSSCAPCKRLTKKCPPVVIKERYDSIIVKDTIVYKDKVIPVYIKGDTQYVEKPLPVAVNIAPLKLENQYALAKAWVENTKLKLWLQTKEQVINLRVDSAIQIAKHWEYKWRNEKQVEIIKERYIPKLYKYALSFSIIIVLLGIGWGYLKARKFW